MIINKSAYERGFAHGAVYKSYLRDLNEGQSSNARSKYRLIRKKDKVDLQSHGLDSDGLPYLGQKLEHGQADQCIYDTVLQ